MWCEVRTSTITLPSSILNFSSSSERFPLKLMLLSSRCVVCVPNKRSLEVEEIISVVIINARKMLHTYNVE